MLKMIPDIVDTCAACRKWAKPLPDAQTSVEIVDAFNVQVECDLMFVHKYIIMHFRRQVHSMAPRVTCSLQVS